MKKASIIILLAAALAGSGCSILKHNTPQDAATSIRVHVGEDGKDYSVSIAKDTSFQKLDFAFGDIHIKAASITGNASGPLAVAGESNAKAGAALESTVKASGEAVSDAAQGVVDAVKGIK
ncbi:hypothetical protein OpiT1DRAFT_00210 [Opitutaceae bacterium TAV1]|nr:hypothetical protein OpiT1DRAFT_00210 [Opitutaceae bacterium TAV1]